ncbi:MAG: phage tail protein [Reinekea sp.]
MSEFIPFRFKVSLFAADGGSASDPICQGAFSEVTGFEASMSPKTMKEGGRNWGEIQLAGTTNFPAIVFKRGMTDIDDLYQWFDVTSRQANYAFRMTGVIEVYDQPFVDQQDVKPRLTWQVSRAMATRFKATDLSATSNQIAIEELHLVHEGLTLKRQTKANSGDSSSGERP